METRSVVIAPEVSLSQPEYSTIVPPDEEADNSLEDVGTGYERPEL